MIPSRPVSWKLLCLVDDLAAHLEFLKRAGESYSTLKSRKGGV
jgi:hypothetical protein